MILETIKRLKAPVPVYFRKVQVLLGTVGGASIFALNFFPDMTPGLSQVLHIGADAGVVGAFLSQLAVQDKSQIK